MQTLIAFMDRWSERRSDQTYSRFVDIEGNEIDRYTYQSFAARTRELASCLYTDAGLRRGDRALLVYPPGLEMMAAFYACARIGVIAVPVNPPTPVGFESGMSKLTFIARDCQAKVVLSTAEYEVNYQLMLAHHEAATLLTDNATVDLPWFATDVTRGFGGAAVADAPGETLFLQYTSGSTSDPKGVVVSHANVIANGEGIGRYPNLVSWLPQHHDMGLIAPYLFGMVHGATTHGMSPADFLQKPSQWLRLISDVRATDGGAPNFALEYCLREDKLPESELAGIDLSTVTISCGAEPVRANSVKRFNERFAPYGLRPDAVVSAYGLAEHTLCVAIKGRQVLALNKRALEKDVVRVEKALPETSNQTPLVSCGKPLANNVVRVVDPQSAEDLGEGRIGEIWVDGAAKGGGYWQRRELSADTFEARIVGDDEHTYLRTGDLGFLHEGELFVYGRIKDLVIVRGVNCYPSDIEAVVERSAPEVRTGCLAAFSIEHDDEEVLVVVAEVRDVNLLPDPKELARAIRRYCHIDPHTVVFVPPRSVAKTTSGKIMRSKTRQLWRNGDLDVLATYEHQPHEAPTSASGPMERFRYLMESYDLTGDEDMSFADLGIDSVALAELRTELRTLLEDHGAAELADEVDTRLLLRLTVAEFFGLVRQFGSGSESGSALPLDAVRDVLGQIAAENEEFESTMMRHDAALPLPALPPAKASGVEDNLLLTGVTGFVGPFLLASLLKRTPHTVHALVRAADAGHGLDRILAALRKAQLLTPTLEAAARSRVQVVCGDLAEPNMGVGEAEFQRLAGTIDTIVHNGALVNYVRSYDSLRAANVAGTREILRLAMTTHRKAFHLVSSTFIYGWSGIGTPEIFEPEGNLEMNGLDFGYSQSKWVAEQLVLAAARQGLDVRVYRPSLISPTREGFGSREDILIRLLSFMIEHGVAVDARNQVSLLPADLVADHIVELMDVPAESGIAYNMTADDYYSISDLTLVLTDLYGYEFTYYDIPSFKDEVNRRATSRDPIYPLADFISRSAGKIVAMADKRYNSAQYQMMRKAAGVELQEPELVDTVRDLHQFLQREQLITDARAEVALRT